MTITSFGPNTKEVTIPDASIVFTGGSWANAAGAGAQGGANASSGSMQVCTVATQFATITTPICTDIFLNMVTGGDMGPFSVSIDGNPINAYHTCYAPAPGMYSYRTLKPIGRNLQRMAHQVIVTCLAGDLTKIAFDSIVCVDGGVNGANRIFGDPRSFVVLGDSTSNNYAVHQDATWPAVVSRLLANAGHPVILNNLAQTAQALAGSFQHPVGGCQTTWQVVTTLNPAILGIQFGLNDLAGDTQNQYTSALDFLTIYQGLLSFYQAAFDTRYTVQIVVGGPPYVAADNFHSNYNFPLIAIPQVAQGGVEQYVGAIRELRSIIAGFPEMLYSDNFEAMDYNAELVYPNGSPSQPDTKHPNDAGNGIEAARFFATYMRLG